MLLPMETKSVNSNPQMYQGSRITQVISIVSQKSLVRPKVKFCFIRISKVWIFSNQKHIFHHL